MAREYRGSNLSAPDEGEGRAIGVGETVRLADGRIGAIWERFDFHAALWYVVEPVGGGPLERVMPDALAPIEDR
jgi:hypothetical protein